VTTTAAQAPEARRPGRPRDPQCDHAILEAALAEYAVNGLEVMSVDAVAARAGVSKATIYRRYPSKLELVVAAAFQLAEDKAPKPDTGSLRGDLTASLTNLSQLLSDPVHGPATRMLLTDAVRNDELSRMHADFVRVRREGTIAALHRATERGELRDDVDLDIAIDSLAGPVFYRHIVMHEQVDAAYIDAIIDNFVRTYGSTEASR
jgi:AcrR family transcriptional regulator